MLKDHAQSIIANWAFKASTIVAGVSRYQNELHYAGSWVAPRQVTSRSRGVFLFFSER